MLKVYRLLCKNSHCHIAIIKRQFLTFFIKTKIEWLRSSVSFTYLSPMAFIVRWTFFSFFDRWRFTEIDFNCWWCCFPGIRRRVLREKYLKTQEAFFAEEAIIITRYFHWTTSSIMTTTTTAKSSPTPHFRKPIKRQK